MRLGSLHSLNNFPFLGNSFAMELPVTTPRRRMPSSRHLCQWEAGRVHPQYCHALATLHSQNLAPVPQSFLPRQELCVVPAARVGAERKGRSLVFRRQNPGPIEVNGNFTVDFHRVRISSRIPHLSCSCGLLCSLCLKDNNLPRDVQVRL